MPSNPKIVVSPQARDDIRDILQYSYEQWGAERRTWQRKRLTSEIRQLGDYPRLGPVRTELGYARRSKVVDPYVIYYRIEDHVVRVIRVLHIRRDATALLGEEDATTSAG
jgi:toxin ParE1/3/4